jgi:hypothetical protein
LFVDLFPFSGAGLGALETLVVLRQVPFVTFLRFLADLLDPAAR